MTSDEHALQKVSGRQILAVAYVHDLTSADNGFTEVKLLFTDGTTLTLATNCYYAMEARFDGNDER